MTLLRPYLYYAKMRIMMQLNYRIEVLASLGLNLIPLATMVFLWKSIYAGRPPVAGVDASEMVTYSILAIAIKDVFYLRTQDVMLEAVKSGAVEIELMRPGGIFARLLSEDLAGSAVSLFRRLVPLIVASMFIFQFPRPDSLVAALLFPVSLICAYAILWLLSLLCGLVAFWFMEIGNLGMVKDAVIKVFSGSIIPLWLFPAEVQRVSMFLPFQYTYHTPLGIYIGKISPIVGLHQIGLQLGWAIVLALLAAAVWARAKNKLVIQGG